MSEFWVDAEENGITVKITCDDKFFDYIKYRRYLSGKGCISLINSMKKKFNKKAAIIYGNCQTGELQNFFLQNSKFIKEYFLIKMPMVCEYDDKSLKFFQENFWSVCDLLISQHVKDDNRFSPLLATKKLSEKISRNAKIVWIPNVYFDGYFPQLIKNLRNVDRDKHQSGRFPNGDKYVDEFLTNNTGKVKISDLVNYLEKQEFISEKEVLFHAEKSLEELKEREKICDIHMSDMVADNYKSRQIFYATNHPTQDILLELAKRILRRCIHKKMW